MDNMEVTTVEQTTKKKRLAMTHKILTVIGTALCVILVPILILNCVLIWKMYRNPDSVPKFGGIIPLVVQTDVMSPDVQFGDLIICQAAKPETLREGEIITFVNGSTTKGLSIGVNRVTEVTSKDGAPVITVTEQNEEGSRIQEIATEDIIGVYRRGFRGLGKFILFMQTTQGLIFCVFLPILLFVGYDVLRTRLGEKRSREETEKLAAELEALRKTRYGQASGG